MKKITSLLMAALMLCTMLCAFALPAFAEDKPTEVVPSNGFVIINSNGNYIISNDYEVNNLSVTNANATLTIAKGVTVKVKQIFLINMAKLNVCGTLIISDSATTAANLSGTICVFNCSSGKIEGNFSGKDTVTTYNDHFFVNGKCACGKFECDITGKHNWVNGGCSICNTPCEHQWDKNDGICAQCGYICPHDGNTCVECGKELHSLGNGAIGSALSEGSLTIICSIAGIAVGFLAAMFIFKKKKPALASGENKDEE